MEASLSLAGAACRSFFCHLSCHICFHRCMLACNAEAHNCPAARSPWYGPDRPKWLGPLEYSYDTYQTGDAPGDYAYDILQLGRDQKDFERYYELEILHSRWAMLGALGALIPGRFCSARYLLTKDEAASPQLVGSVARHALVMATQMV